MKCINCKCCHIVQRERYNKQTQKFEKHTVQQCWGVPEPFTISNVYADCVAYPEKHQKEKETKEGTIDTKKLETVTLPLSVGDCYYTRSIVFYDKRDESENNLGGVDISVRKRLIKNKSDIYEYMMLKERGQAYLAEEDAKNIEINLK